MDESLFATPVSGELVAVRESPPTPLVVLPFDDPARAQVVVAPPASWPALRPPEVDALRPYFVWDAGESFWWRTQYPAVFSLERLASDLWAGRLQSVGRVVPAGDDAKRRPPGADYLFGTYREPSRATVREPWGPGTVRDAENRAIEPHRARAARIVIARFPSFGPEAVWLRLCTPAGQRDPYLQALDDELHALRTLGARDHSCVVEVLHAGTLDVTNYAGRYAALRPPVGVALSALFDAAGTSHLPDRAALVREVALSVARTVSLAHDGEPSLCLGPISPALLRVRPALVEGRPGVRTTFVSLPAAGAPGGKVPAGVLDLFPEGDAEFLVQQLRPHHVRSVAADLRSLGYLVHQLIALSQVRADDTERVAQRLIAGEIGSASAALTELAAV
jgi:hypothetical protein